MSSRDAAPPGPARVVSVEPYEGTWETCYALLFTFDQDVAAQGEVTDVNLQIGDPAAYDEWAVCRETRQVGPSQVAVYFDDVPPPGFATVARYRVLGPLAAITCPNGFEVVTANITR